jgi:hypothetical protein
VLPLQPSDHLTIQSRSSSATGNVRYKKRSKIVNELRERKDCVKRKEELPSVVLNRQEESIRT